MSTTTPEQIVRMKKMGIIAEANIGSNLKTGSIADVNDHPLLHNIDSRVRTPCVARPPTELADRTVG